jgi:hypothetical protein
MVTAARYAALQWFLDHETLGPDAMLRRKPPLARMRRLMAKEGHVSRLPLAQFALGTWSLTPHGSAVLKTKPARKRRTADADERNREQGGGGSARGDHG